MHKKLLMACMAIAAFAAFVIAPAASASPELTENGATVAVGKTIIATNTGTTEFVSEAFTVECSTAHLTGTVTANSGTKIKGEILAANAKFNGTGSGGDCTSKLGDTRVTVTSKLCLETTTVDNFTVTGCGANVKFDLFLTPTQTNCEYTTASVPGTFTTNLSPAPAVVSGAPATRVGTNPFCPATGKLNMTFDLYTDTVAEEPLTIS